MKRAVPIAMILAVWYILTVDQSRQEMLLFPSPGAIIYSFAENWTAYLIFTLNTIYRVLVGLFLGLVVGAIFVFTAYRSQIFYTTFDPVIEMVRPIPPIALTPFFILWFGLGDFGQFLIVALGCFMIIYVNGTVAIRNLPSEYLYAARTLGAGWWSIFRYVLFPAIVPDMLAALRVGAASGFGLALAAEYLGAQGGLGFLIRNARTTLDTDAIGAAVILVGVSAVAIDGMLRLVFGKLTSWKDRVEVG